VLKAIVALSIATNYIEDFLFIINHDHEVGTLQTIPSSTFRGFLSKKPKMPSIQEDNIPTERFKTPTISFPKKFNCTRSKFR